MKNVAGGATRTAPPAGMGLETFGCLPSPFSEGCASLGGKMVTSAPLTWQKEASLLTFIHTPVMEKV